MKKTTEQGFTLIELLAVIVILAIIALIAVPVIMNIIDKANKSAFKDTAYGIISAGELYFAEQQLNPMGMSKDETITLPDTTKQIELKGDVPQGKILVTKDGKIAIAVYNNRYCVTKGIDDKDITITDDFETCELPSGSEENTESTTNTLSSLATTSTEVPNKPSCLTDGTTCAAGTPVAIKVNESETYNFYVISETDNKVTLIMDRNLGDNVRWISGDDYTTANSEEGDNTSCKYTACTDEGPLTAVATLKQRTSGWTNIQEKEYTYSDDGGGNAYTAFTENMRARMLTYTESTTTLGCQEIKNGSCPSWLYINLYNTGINTDSTGTKIFDYWTSAAYAGYFDAVYIIDYNGYIASANISSYSNYTGVRPVIELSKQ